MSFDHCSSCGSEHLGPVPCGLSFRDRMRSIELDQGVLETRTRRNYFDVEPIRQTFGEDANERMLDETDGLGFAQQGPDGELYRKDRKSGDVVRVSDGELNRVYLGGRREREFDPARDG